jgi:hypothetical protein
MLSHHLQGFFLTQFHQPVNSSYEEQPHYHQHDLSRSFSNHCVRLSRKSVHRRRSRTAAAIDGAFHAALAAFRR